MSGSGLVGVAGRTAVTAALSPVISLARDRDHAAFATSARASEAAICDFGVVAQSGRNERLTRYSANYSSVCCSWDRLHPAATG